MGRLREPRQQRDLLQNEINARAGGMHWAHVGDPAG